MDIGKVSRIVKKVIIHGHGGSSNDY